MVSSRLVSGAFLACTLAIGGCTDLGQADDVNARVTLVDTRTNALLSSAIESITGTYSAECLARASGDWSLAVTGSPMLDHTALTVVRGDTDCVLTFTGIRTTTGLYAASSNIVLGTSYAGSAASFDSPIEFYANAKLSISDFSNDFTLTLLFSDDLATASGTNTAGFVVATATASAQGVEAPDYTLSLAGVSVLTDINDVVSSVTGNMTLTIGVADATNYVIVGASVDSTYDDIDTAYLAGTPVAMATSIAGSSLLAAATDITTSAVRTLILAKVVDGVRSYQAFTITFAKAAT